MTPCGILARQEFRPLLSYRAYLSRVPDAVQREALAKRCTADPGPPGIRCSRARLPCSVCGGPGSAAHRYASLHAALRPGHGPQALRSMRATRAASPRVAHGAGAGIGGGARGELAVELAEEGDAVGEAKLGAGGDERGIPRRRRAVGDEARAGKGLKQRRQCRIAHPVVRPGEPPAQRERSRGVERDEPVEARAELAPRVGAGARIISERKSGAAAVDLAVAGRAEALRLD